MYFFTTQRHTQLVCHPSDRKKPLIFIVLQESAKGFCPRFRQAWSTAAKLCNAALRTGFRAGTLRIRLRVGRIRSRCPDTWIWWLAGRNRG